MDDKSRGVALATPETTGHRAENEPVLSNRAPNRSSTTPVFKVLRPPLLPGSKLRASPLRHPGQTHAPKNATTLRRMLARSLPAVKPVVGTLPISQTLSEV